MPKVDWPAPFEDLMPGVGLPGEEGEVEYHPYAGTDVRKVTVERPPDEGWDARLEHHTRWWVQEMKVGACTVLDATF